MKLFSALSFLTFGVATAAVGSATSQTKDGIDAETSKVFLRGAITVATSDNARRLGLTESESEDSSMMDGANTTSTSSDDGDSYSASVDTTSESDDVEDMNMNMNMTLTSTGSSGDGDSASASASASADTSTSADDTPCASIVDTICAMEDTTVFCDILKNSTSDLPELEDSSEEYTLFVPLDEAFGDISSVIEQLSDDEAGRVIGFHIYEGEMLTSDELVCGEKLTSITTQNDESRTKCSGDTKYQTGNGNTKTGSLPEILSADQMACNGVIHTLDHVMFPVSLRQLEQPQVDMN